MAKTNIPVLYRIFKAYVKFLVEKVYYRRVHYINTGNVPSDGTPLLIVSDHQNSLNDALGVLLSISDRIVHFIVRADVFALGPFVDKFLRKIGLLPAFRLDWEGESALNNNAATFRDSEKVLLDGNTVVIYPEAGHQTRHFLGTFSYGYTKMAFEAAEMENFEKEIFILPSCNHYSAYRYLRTDMLIEYGTPISIKPFYELYKMKPRTAQRHVNALVREQIKSMMLSVDDIDNYDAIDFIRQGRYGQEFAKRAGLDPDQLPQKLQSDRTLVAALTSAKESRPEAVAEVYAEAAALKQEMVAEGLTDTELDATPSIITLIVNAIVMVALVPLAVFAVWPSIPAWIIPRHFWKKAEDEMFSGTFLIALNALLIFPVLGLITFLITWAKASLLAAVIYVALFPALCLFEWAYYGWGLELLRGVNARRLDKSGKLASVRAKREKLYKDIDTILNN